MVRTISASTFAQASRISTAKILGTGGRDHIRWIADTRCRRQKLSQTLLGFVAKLPDGESLRFTGVGTENAGTTGIGQNRYAPAFRQRLAA